MFKVEIYKLLHSKNLLYLFLVVVPVAAYLGTAVVAQMGIKDIDSTFSMAFVSSSAVLMLYFTIHSSMFISREYGSNSFRVLVGTGMSRQQIILAKYVLFIVSGLSILLVHGFFATIFTIVKSVNKIDGHILLKSILYLFPFVAILSVMFLLSIMGRTIIKALIFNIAFIVLSSVSVQSINVTIPVLPIQAMQVIAESKSEHYFTVVAFSLAYSLACYIASMVIFKMQEL